MYSIHVTSQQRLLRVDRARLVRLAEATLASEQVRSAEISLALVDDRHIHEINRRFLGHDYPTDVISFLLESESPRKSTATSGKRTRRKAAPPAVRGAGKSLGGEIIISVETAIKEAAEYGWRPIHELSLYVVHGLLHLCGYDDLTPGEKRVMRAREVEVLAPWRIAPRYVV